MPRVRILQQALADEELYRLMPLPFPGDESVVLEHDDMPRKVYVSPEVMEAVSAPFPDTDEGRRLGAFRGWLDAFLLNAEISVCENPDCKPPETDLARVRPVEAEFWSIRVMEPQDTDGLRSLGAFHDKDEFIALTWQYREIIGDQFDDEVDEVQSYWCNIFGAEIPHKGESLDDYLTHYVAYKA
jgi:hypothetical protein